MRKYTYIYVLKDPISNEVRYVGKSNKPTERFYNHMNRHKDKNTHKRNWIEKLRKNGLKPKYEVIDKVLIEEWQEKEKYYIEKYIKDGCNLLNCTNGGDGLTFGNQTSYKIGHGSVPVISLKLNGEFFKKFNSIDEANKFVNGKSIIHALRKNQKTSAGYIWLYEKDYELMNENEIAKYVSWATTKEFKINITTFKKGDKKPNAKEIHQYDIITGEYIKTWKSSRYVCKILNFKCPHNIRACAIGKRNYAYNYYWSYDKKQNYKND